MPLNESSSVATASAQEPRPDRVSPRFFGNADKRLYACHHHPAVDLQAPAAIVLCNAALHEYERTHRAMRQLAILAARRGIHAMRFDYYATGDSGGACTEISLAQWRDDINAALDECRALAGASQPSLFGLRLGARLALEMAAAREDVDSLVLYAPVLDGAALVQEWRARQGAADGSPRSATAEAGGFPLTSGFVDQLAGLVPAMLPSTLRRVMLIAGDDDADAHALALRLEEGGAAVSFEPTHGAAIWQQDPMQAMVPFKLLRRIVAWLEERP